VIFHQSDVLRCSDLDANSNDRLGDHPINRFHRQKSLANRKDNGKGILAAKARRGSMHRELS
jgi:hypothetical protein